MKFRNLAKFISKTRKYCIILNNLKQGSRINKWDGTTTEFIPYHDDIRHGIMYRLCPFIIYVDMYNKGQMYKHIAYSRQHNTIVCYQNKIHNLIHGIEYSCEIIGMKKTQRFHNYKNGFENGISKEYSTIGPVSILASISYYDDEEINPSVTYFYRNGQVDAISIYDNNVFDKYRYYKRKALK